jgi:hypothetical protein
MENNIAGFYDFVAQNMNNLQEKIGYDRYLEEQVLPYNSKEFDILSWWKTNGIKYPILQTIARGIFCIMVSTVASESTFSTGGRIVNPHHSGLHSGALKAFMHSQN